MYTSATTNTNIQIHQNKASGVIQSYRNTPAQISPTIKSSLIDPHVFQYSQQQSQYLQELSQQQLQVRQESKNNWQSESPKFLKYFFKDCVDNQEKMNFLLESQKKQIKENDQTQKTPISSQNTVLFTSESLSSKHNDLNNPLNFSQFIQGSTFTTPLIPHIPQEFQTKIPSFDVYDMIDCLQELQAAHILPTKNKKNGNPNADEIPKNDNKWHIHENEVPILIKKHSSEGQKALLSQNYSSALSNLKKSEILMNASFNKNGQIDTETLLFIKSNLGICYYKIGLLQEAFTNFSICLFHLKKTNIIPTKTQSLHHNKDNSCQNIIPRTNSFKQPNNNSILPFNHVKKRSTSNQTSVNQKEYLQNLAQKLKQKKLKGDILLQACIVLSEQGKHEAALILSKKASKIQLNYIIDTLIATYHIIIQSFKEKDQPSNELESLTTLSKPKRGNSAHSTTSSSQTFDSSNKNHLRQKPKTHISAEIDFLEDNPFKQICKTNSNLQETIEYHIKLVSILKEVMKKTEDLHCSFIHPSKIKMLEVMSKIINNMNTILISPTHSNNKSGKSGCIQHKQPSSTITTSKGNSKGDVNIEKPQFEINLYERPDLEFLFSKIINDNHWVLKTNILSLLQLKSVSIEDTSISKTTIEQETKVDAILNKLSHLCVSFYCISTETRFINDQKKNIKKDIQSQLPSSKTQTHQQKYAKFLVNLNYEVSESENWLSRSLEIAYIFLPHDMPLVGQIVSVHNKFHNINKIVIQEDSNEYINDDDDNKEENSSKKRMINSSEYTCALISLPGGSKSNFFIPLVRKIKPQILNNNKNDCKNYKTEEDIEKLYKKYTSLTPVSRMSEQQMFILSQSAPQTDRSKSHDQTQLHQHLSKNKTKDISTNQKQTKNICTASTKDHCHHPKNNSIKHSLTSFSPVKKDNKTTTPSIHKKSEQTKQSLNAQKTQTKQTDIQQMFHIININNPSVYPQNQLKLLNYSPDKQIKEENTLNKKPSTKTSETSHSGLSKQLFIIANTDSQKQRFQDTQSQLKTSTTSSLPQSTKNNNNPNTTFCSNPKNSLLSSSSSSVKNSQFPSSQNGKNHIKIMSLSDTIPSVESLPIQDSFQKDIIPYIQKHLNHHQKQQQPSHSRHNQKKPLSADKMYSTTDTSFTSKKKQPKNTFLNKINQLFKEIAHPQSAKNSTLLKSTAINSNEVSSRSHVQQVNQSCDTKRIQSISKASRSKSLNKTVKPSSTVVSSTNSTRRQSSAHQPQQIQQPLITNQTKTSQSFTNTNNSPKKPSLITSSSNQQIQQQDNMKNNILSEIFNIGLKQSSISLDPSLAQPVSPETIPLHQQFLQQQQQLLIQQQHLFLNSSPHVQKQLIHHLKSTNNTSKAIENIVRSNSSEQRQHHKDSQRIQQINLHQTQNTIKNEINEKTSKLKKRSENSISFLEDNYMKLFEGSQSTKSSQIESKNFINQYACMINKTPCHSAVNTERNKDFLNLIEFNDSFNSKTSKQTPASINPSTTAAVHDKKLHMLRRLRSNVSKVPSDLLRNK